MHKNVIQATIHVCIQIRDRLPHLKAIIQYKGCLSKSYDNVYEVWNVLLWLHHDVDPCFNSGRVLCGSEIRWTTVSLSTGLRARHQSTVHCSSTL